MIPILAAGRHDTHFLKLSKNAVVIQKLSPLLVKSRVGGVFAFKAWAAVWFL